MDGWRGVEKHIVMTVESETPGSQGTNRWPLRALTHPKEGTENLFQKNRFPFRVMGESCVVSKKVESKMASFCDAGTYWKSVRVSKSKGELKIQASGWIVIPFFVCLFGFLFICL